MRGQGERGGDVLREPLDPQGEDRLPRGVGGLRHRVQLPGLAQLDVHVAGGLRDRREPRRQRLDLGGQRRPALRDAVAGRAEAPPGPLRARAERGPLQPQPGAPPLLLVEQRGGARPRRQPDPLPDALDGLPRLPRGGHLARGLREGRPVPRRQSPERPRLPLQPRQPRGLHGCLPPVVAGGGGALLLAGGRADEEDLVVRGRRRRDRLAPRAVRRQERLRGGAGRALPQPGDVRAPRAAGVDPLHGVLAARAGDRRHHAREPGGSRRSRAEGGEGGLDNPDVRREPVVFCGGRRRPAEGRRPRGAQRAAQRGPGPGRARNEARTARRPPLHARARGRRRPRAPGPHRGRLGLRAGVGDPPGPAALAGSAPRGRAQRRRLRAARRRAGARRQAPRRARHVRARACSGSPTASAC